MRLQRKRPRATPAPVKPPTHRSPQIHSDLTPCQVRRADDTYSPCVADKRPESSRSRRSTPPSGRWRRTPRSSATGSRARRTRAPTSSSSASSAISGYPAEDLYLKRHFLARCADELAELAAEVEGIARSGRLPRAAARFRRPARGRRAAPAARPQLAGAPSRRRGRGGLPKAATAELRGLRRAALLRAGHRAGRGRGRGNARRPDDLRGRVGAGAAGDPPRPSWAPS